MDPVYTTKYRALTARGNYLGQDRSDIRFAVRELSHRMAKPRRRDWRRLVRLRKYLVGKERFINEFNYQKGKPVH